MRRAAKSGLVSVPRFTGGGRSFSNASKKIADPEVLGFLPYIAAAIYTAVKLAQVDKRILAAFSEMYGENYLKNLGLTYDQALEVVRCAAALYKSGYPRDRAKFAEMKGIIGAKMGMKDTLPITRLLFFMEDIRKDNYPTLNDYLSPQGQTIQSYKTAISQTVESGASAAKESVKDTLKEAGQVVSESLPWYAKPKILAIGVLAIGAIYALTMAKQFLPKIGVTPLTAFISAMVYLFSMVLGKSSE